MTKYILTDPTGTEWPATYQEYGAHHIGIGLDGEIGKLLHPMSRPKWEEKGWAVRAVRKPGFYACKDMRWVFELTTSGEWRRDNRSVPGKDMKYYEPLFYLSRPYEQEIPF